MGGLHRFEDWHGHLLTDSGGYQVFSLDPGGNVKLDDDGVTFRSTYDGGTHRLTPELAVDIQTTRSEERRVGKECSVRVDLGCRSIIKKKRHTIKKTRQQLN